MEWSGGIRRAVSSALGWAVGLAALLAVASPARAQTAPEQGTLAAHPNWPAVAIATNGLRTFVGGGKITQFGTRTHGTAVVSADSGALRQVPADAGIGELVTAVAAPDGGWYVASTRKVRRLRPDGSVDPGFAVDCGDAVIRRVALDGTRLFIAGEFDEVNGAARRGLAAVDAATGAVLPWTAAEASNGWGVVAAGGVVYFAGRSSTGAGVLALDGVSGAVLARGPAG